MGLPMPVVVYVCIAGTEACADMMDLPGPAIVV